MTADKWIFVCSTKFKLVILDECDAMTKDAQFALRRGELMILQQSKWHAVQYSSYSFLILHAVIEKYTRNARFCLICNYVSKIIPALQSRCTRFRFPPLGEQHVRERLQHVIDSERWAALAEICISSGRNFCEHSKCLQCWFSRRYVSNDQFPKLYLSLQCWFGWEGHGGSHHPWCWRHAAHSEHSSGSCQSSHTASQTEACLHT